MHILLLIGAAILIGAISKSLGNSDMTMPRDSFYAWDGLIKQYADAFGVPFDWAKAICIVESDLGRDSRVKLGLLYPENSIDSASRDGKSWGLFQVTVPTARMFQAGVTPIELNDPDINARIAIQNMAYIISKKGMNPEAFARSYNGGLGYASTVAGQRDTPAYYQKWLSALEKIKLKG